MKRFKTDLGVLAIVFATLSAFTNKVVKVAQSDYWTSSNGTSWTTNVGQSDPGHDCLGIVGFLCVGREDAPGIISEVYFDGPLKTELN